MAERIPYEEVDDSPYLSFGVPEFHKMMMALHGELNALSVLEEEVIASPTETTMTFDAANRPRIGERLSLKETDEHFGDFMPTEEEWQKLQLADQVDARYDREILHEPYTTPAVEVERAILQLLGFDVGVEYEEFSVIDPEKVRLAQLFAAAKYQMALI